MRMTASQSIPDASSVISPDEWDLRLGSPSKINLFLRVVGKRKDGKYYRPYFFYRSLCNARLDLQNVAPLTKLSGFLVVVRMHSCRIS